MTTEALSPTRPVSTSLRHWAPLPVVLAGTFMVVLDFFIVNVALPSIQSSLHASSGALEWIMAGYALTSAVFLIPAARAGDHFGRRRAFSAGLALFTVSSALCGAAPTAGTLVIGRLFQGAGGALLMPNVLALISTVYADADRVRALSIYGVTMGVAAVGGQLLGGALVALDLAGLGWRACFLINVPVGLLALALAPRLIPESRARVSGNADLVGTALVTATLVAIVLPLVQGRQLGWPAWTWVSLALAPILLGALVVHQLRLTARGSAPLFHLALFRRRAFSAGLVAQLAFWCGQASFFMVFALYLQQGRGLSALHAGLVFTILAVTYVVASAGAPGLALRHGRRLLGIAALLVAAGHLSLLAAVDSGPLVALVPGLMLVGGGMGLAIAPLATLILAAAPEHGGAASGLLTTMQNVGNAIGVAVIGVVFFGAVHTGVAGAFQLSLAVLAGMLVAVAALTRLLPAPAPSAEPAVLEATS